MYFSDNKFPRHRVRITMPSIDSYHKILSLLQSEQFNSRAPGDWLTEFASCFQTILSEGENEATVSELIDTLFKSRNIADGSLEALNLLTRYSSRKILAERVELPARQLELILGGLNFLNASTLMKYGKTKEATNCLQKECTKKFILTRYQISANCTTAEQLKDICAHEMGTTSMILRIGKDGDSVLKLLQPQYLDEHVMASALRDYGSRYSGSKGHVCEGLAPRIYEAGYGWINMEFLDGVTLRRLIDGDVAELRERFMDRAISRRAERTARKDFHQIMRQLFQDLLLALEKMGEKNVYHYDLSPTNIIVDRVGGIYKVRFIDFGVNNLLVRNVGYSGDLEEVQVYASEEVRDGNPNGVLSDLYSFGIMALEYCCGRKVSLDDLERGLDEVWLRMPDLAVVIDDCLTRRLEHRVLECRMDRGGSGIDSELNMTGVYRVLASRFLEACVRAEENGHSRWLGQVFNYQVLDQIFRLRVFSGNYVFRANVRNGGDGEWETDTWKLDLARNLCIIAVTLCVATVPMSMAFGELYSAGLVEELRRWFGLSKVESKLAWPGWVICVSFAMVAGNYYLNIFQSVDIYSSRLDGSSTGWRYALGRFWLRFNAVCFAGPILFALIVYPPAWPICLSCRPYFCRRKQFVRKDSRGESTQRPG